MEKLPMCRMCLVDKVPMFRMVNRNLHDLYEKLTDNPFVTGDCRPMLACSFCYAKLKQCYRLLIQCLEAEERFAQRLNEDYKVDYSINQDLSGFFCGFSKSPIELISILDECQTESIAAKVELPAVSEILDDIIEPKEEYQSEELEPETLDNICLDVGDIPPLHSEAYSEDDVPLVEFKIEVEEQEVTEKIQRARDTKKLEPETLDNMCLDVGDIPPLHSEAYSEDDVPLVEFKIEVEEQEVTEKIQRARDTKKLEPEKFDNSCLVVNTPPHYSESDSEDDVPILEFKTEAVEKQEVKEKKRGARDTKRTTVRKKSKLEARKIKLEVAITAEQTKQQKLDSRIIHTARKRSPKSDTYFTEPYIHTGTQMGEKRYKCSVCQRSFKYKYLLLRHIRIHTGEKLKCHVCLLSLGQKSKLTDHICVHTSEPNKCDVCSRCFSERSNLLRHILIHTGEKPFKCDICELSFQHKNSLTKHIRIHTGEKPYKCNVCERSFSQNRALTTHIRIHTGEKPYKCDICELSFQHKNSLKKHIRIHTGEKPYKCNVCERSFRLTSSLTKHIRIHTGEKPYKCNVCERSFSQSGALTKHIRIHTGEKPFKCDICQLSFKQKNSLTTHIRIHTGEKPYKCNACERSFSQSGSLTTHISIHTGEKPYKCNVCQRSFRENGYLTKHMRIHTGEKSKKCDVCPRTFTSKCDLQSHICIDTGEKPVSDEYSILQM